MFSELPMLTTHGETSEEKVAEIENYLYMLREALEMELSNIDTDNLSDDLIRRLEGLGVDISLQEKKTQDYIQQISQRTLSVRDVVESKMFADKLQEEKATIPTMVIDSEQFLYFMAVFKDALKEEILEEIGGTEDATP